MMHIVTVNVTIRLSCVVFKAAVRSYLWPTGLERGEVLAQLTPDMPALSESDSPQERIGKMEELSNRRLQIMQQLEKTLDDELEQMEDVTRDFEEENLIEEDEDYLFNLERHRRKMEKEKMKGTLKEPSLVVCWVIVLIVTIYVIILSFSGDKDKALVKDEL